MADFEYYDLVGRIGLRVTDGPDADALSDVLRPQLGAEIHFTPSQKEVLLTEGEESEVTAVGVHVAYVNPDGYLCATVETDANGSITGYGDSGIKLPRLKGPRVNPPVADDKGDWSSTFVNFTYVANAGTDYADTIRDPHTGSPLLMEFGIVNDLATVSKVPVGGGVPIVVGPRGYGLNGDVEQTAIDKIRFGLNDGTLTDEITLPPGAPGGSDAATAQWVKEGLETSAALTGSYLYTTTVLTRTMAGIQAAVDRANAAWLAGFIPGATIYMPGGAPYMATEAKPGVELPNTGVPLLFKGDGMSTTVLKKVSSAGTSTNPTHAIHRSIASSVPAGVLRFEDFFIEGVGGHGAAHNVWDKGIYVRGLSGSASTPAVHITRCGAKKNMGETFWTAAALNVYLNNEVSDCPINAYNPVSGQPSDPNSLIIVIGSKADKISNGTGSGSAIETVGASIIVTNNNFTNVHTAINARAHNAVIVTDNVIRDWFGYTVSSPIGTSTAAINIARGNAAWNGPGLFLVEGNNISNYPRGILAQVNAPSDVIGHALIQANVMNGIDQEAVWVQPFEGTQKHIHVIGNSVVNPCRSAHNTYAVFRFGRTGVGATGLVTRPVIKDNVVAIDTATKAKHAVLLESSATVSVTDPLIKDNDFRDVTASALIQTAGTAVTGLARSGNLPGGAVPSCVDSGDHYLWTHGGVQRIKASVPTSLTDGATVGPAVGAATHAAQTGGDKALTQSDSTTWQDIPGVTLALEPGTYSISGFIAATGSTTADLNLRFLPDGALGYSGYYSLGGMVDTATTTTNNLRTVAYLWNASNATLGLVTGNVIPVVVRGTLVVTTAGTIKLQAKQGTAEASDVILRNALVSATKVA